MNKRRAVRILRIVMPLVAIVTAGILAPWDIAFPWLRPLPDSVQAQVDDAIDLGLDGIIVYVDRAGSPPAFYAAGVKNKSTEEPADPHALFKIGSIQKLYVATAIAMLAADGTLSLDDTLAELLPDLAGRIDNAEQITVRMMVRHRSGIPNYSDADGFDWFAPRTSDADHLERVLDRPADFRPDARYRYSNTNYLLLRRILDATSGFGYDTYIAREVLDPLGLSNTYFSLDDAPSDDVVSGYWYGYDDDLRQLHGSMIATAEDVGIFLRALNDGSLLDDEEQAVYTSIYEYGHTGWVPGYYSIARYHEAIDTVVVQFVNTTGGDTWGLSNVTGGKTTGLANVVYGRIVRLLERQ